MENEDEFEESPTQFPLGALWASVIWMMHAVPLLVYSVLMPLAVLFELRTDLLIPWIITLASTGFTLYSGVGTFSGDLRSIRGVATATVMLSILWQAVSAIQGNFFAGCLSGPFMLAGILAFLDSSKYEAWKHQPKHTQHINDSEGPST